MKLTIDGINEALNIVDIWNHYCKLSDFKSRCITDGQPHKTPSYYKRVFYKAKTRLINYIILNYRNLITEWHIENRDDEVFVIIAITVNGNEYRFHQKKKDIGFIWLENYRQDVHTQDCKYYHDEYPDSREYEFDDMDMYNKFCTLIDYLI